MSREHKQLQRGTASQNIKFVSSDLCKHKFFSELCTNIISIMYLVYLKIIKSQCFLVYIFVLFIDKMTFDRE